MKDLSLRVYNKRLMIVEELVYIVFDETNLVRQDQEPKIVDEEDIL